MANKNTKLFRGASKNIRSVGEYMLVDDSTQIAASQQIRKFADGYRHDAL